MKIIRFQSSYAEPYPLQVEGESYHRDEIEEVTSFTGDDEGINADDFIAHLILDDRNINDPNAVAVEIDGKTVGYLSKPNAKKYRAKLIELGLPDIVGECFASVRGGYVKKNTGEQADFGIRLDLIIEELQAYKPTEPKPIESPVQPTINQPELTAVVTPSKITPLRIAGIAFIVLSVCCTCTLLFGYIYGNR